MRVTTQGRKKLLDFNGTSDLQFKCSDTATFLQYSKVQIRMRRGKRENSRVCTNAHTGGWTRSTDLCVHGVTEKGDGESSSIECVTVGLKGGYY